MRSKIAIAIATFVLVALIAVPLMVIARAEQTPVASSLTLAFDECPLIEPVVVDGFLMYRCVLPDETPAPPTPTLAATHTHTPTVTATVTSTPTVTVTPSATPTVTTQLPFPGAPLCAAHDDRAWHGLWNGLEGCHYDHHHGDDPHQLDDVLGTEYYAVAGGEISYPWQTFGVLGTENEAKHDGYIWVVRQDLDYDPRGNDAQITDFRVVVHQLADGHDAPVRYHSAAIEIRGCHPVSGCGYARLGGWQDTGDLKVDGVVIIDEPGSFNREKQHSDHGPVAVWYPSSQLFPQGNQGLFRVSVTTHDQWDFTSPTNPGEYDDYICYPNSACRSNGTYFRPHLIMVDVPAAYEDIVDPDGDNVANYEGWLDRFGTIVEGCTEVSLDCIPFVLENIRTDVAYNYADLDLGRDYDVYFCNNVYCPASSRGARPAGWMQPMP